MARFDTCFIMKTLYGPQIYCDNICHHILFSQGEVGLLKALWPVMVAVVIRNASIARCFNNIYHIHAHAHVSFKRYHTICDDPHLTQLINLRESHSGQVKDPFAGSC